MHERLAIQASDAPDRGGAPPAVLNRETLGEAVRYFLASLVALAVDTGILMALHRGLDVPVIAAAAAGFTAGIFVIYALSIRHVFVYRRLEKRPAGEIAWFWITGIVGLGLTLLLLPLFHMGLMLVPPMEPWPGVALLLAKGLTAGIVFSFNFLARKVVLFTRRVRP